MSTITMELNGYNYDTWKSAKIERALDNMVGSFAFEAVSDANEPFPVKRGDSCRISINGTPVITGFVDVIHVEYGAMEHKIAIAGRDKTCDVTDSHIDAGLEFKAPITLEDVIKKVLEQLEIEDMEVINKVEGLEPFKKEELVSGKVGEKAFEFIDKYASKRQVVLTTDGKGNIVIARASEELTELRLQNLISSPFNTIMKASAEFNDHDRFNLYKFTTQANHSAEPDSTEEPKESCKRDAIWYDDQIRKTRKYVAIAEGCAKKTEIKNRARWEANLREAKSFTYTVTVAELSPHSHDGEPWQPNTLLTVTDEFADIDCELLVIDVKQSISLTGGAQSGGHGEAKGKMQKKGGGHSSHGTVTTLTLLSVEAFKLMLEENSAAEKGKGKTADESKYVSNDAQEYFDKYQEKGSN